MLFFIISSTEIKEFITGILRLYSLLKLYEVESIRISPLILLGYILRIAVHTIQQYVSLLCTIYSFQFSIAEEQRSEATAADLRMIEGLSLEKRFSAYCKKDLAITSALIVARKRRTGT